MPLVVWVALALLLAVGTWLWLTGRIQLGGVRSTIGKIQLAGLLWAGFIIALAVVRLAGG